ncbi:MAG: hypothetical protein DRP45_01595 [Candidatus Zixiibacteriota bacterium]|nr:MAG: hypothetical protein DRP45_01595 [candidate division Zixibacteria bacterium]
MSKTQTQSRALLSIHLVIFLAGFAFLLYEVSWNRLLSLVLGTTVTASTIVLSSFMAGFGTGAYFWGKIANDKKRIGNLLAFLLAGTGVLSALNYFLIRDAIPYLYSSLSSSGFSLGLIEVLVFLIATVLLFIPAFLMGGVFPIISKIAIRSDDSIAPSLGRLYALETLGSAVGGLATGFVLLGMLGQMYTVGVAVAINLILAIWLFLTNKYNQAEQMPAARLAAIDGGHQVARKPHRGAVSSTVNLRKIALVGTLACGFSILGLQVLWLRMFRIYLTNTSYTFALVSSLVILGLFTGSVLFKRWGPDVKDYWRSMLRVLLLMGTTAGLGLVLLIYFPEILMFPFQATLGDPLARVLLLPFVASILIVFPPAVFSGYAFPLACRMYAAGKKNISSDVGVVLMANTIGCVIGPIAASFLLLPLLGATVSVLVMIVVLAGAGAYILHCSTSRGKLKLTRGILYAVTAALVAVIIYQPTIRILPPSFARFDREILFYRESVEGTLSVGQDRGTRTESKYTFVNNSAVIGSTYDAIKVVKMVGHFPFLLGLECKDVLVIGFGIGVTTSAIASHPEVESIECVELVEGLNDAAVFYRDLNRNVVNDPRLKIISGDGRHYLQMTPKKYDLISCDPTHPILGSGNLYTKEYFALCRKHLNPVGMVSQYLPLHKLRTEEFLGIITTFHSEFPNCTVWLGHYHAVLLGSMEPIRVDFEQWAASVASLGQDEYFYSDPYHLAATLVLDGKTIAELASVSKINTDDQSYTEFFAPACLDADNISKNVRFLAQNRTDLNAVFNNIEDSDKMLRFIQGNQLLTESLFHKLRGEHQRSLDMLRRACQINPEDQEFPFLIRLYY